MANVIWTTHLRERIKQRGLNPDWVDRAVRFPDEVQASSTTNSQKHIKIIQGYKIVAAVKRQGGDWIITSAWWNPVYSHPAHQKNNRFFLEKWVDNALRSLEKLFTKK
ncbi:hypothetical protein A3K29_02540 [Candidatus Collierbacteria bacterium RIFOXYB2_FULL_46_14]|uniref:Uncharacterized protein n=1 Tax=Candidatus Collierbacteria bacterium GW2011_GWA2_46_26 TaxID=1618381 RepID=A0A0G1SKT7_9BACT|nr:MAG: hypothetical protein UW29_C0004G0013 [Candidatus Collierbacteria bacterium GW2011_GWC2_44_13]KKU33935.1 MAG: hypothetical protein UX47_C0001G0218 [Candidatus Collierbacteria bacterium GW2011_GWA2_46_26]OGD72998.1 MAG: hypothetical protein A3K29_02540 [Candidatus Collierbacteria bacterium RIFOXYB2_FULL_46_14]OGD76040.1 MAG: hypothetical protein A3K43_02540 [Candidatus Collierbacteria bacterium RIFOXYA2_FULL_46_20]OGD77376.1 MAG: hypothetical protein A3K39_02540 [Candidatus Collierbacteri